MAIRYLLRKNEILSHAEKKDNFLEVGGGNLKLSSELLKFYKSGVTYEPAEKTSGHYDDMDPEEKNRLKFYPRLFEDTDEFETKFDLVIACEVLEHIDDDTAFMKMLLDRLKEDGQVIVSMPARKKYWSYHDEVVGHVRRYELEDFKRIFSQLEGYKYEVIAYGYPFINILRYLRILYAKIYMGNWEEMDAEKQTELSGTQQELKNISMVSDMLEKLKIIQFMSWIASHFNKYNLSEGYILIVKHA